MKRGGYRSKPDSELDLNTMSLAEVVFYVKSHPQEEELASRIRANYNNEKLTALLETAALHGLLNEPIFRGLERESH